MSGAEEEEELLLEEEDFRAVLQTVQGRRFVWHILDRVAAIHSGSFSTDALGMAFGEGRRAVGLELMRDAQRIAPELYVLAVQEAIETDRRIAAERAAREAEEEL